MSADLVFSQPDMDGFQSPQVDPEHLTGCYVLVYEQGQLERRGRIFEHPAVIGGRPDPAAFKIGWFHWPLVEDQPAVTSASSPDSLEVVHREQMTAGWSFTMAFDRWSQVCDSALLQSAKRENVARLSDWRSFSKFGYEREH